jgi:hypothetical protein
MKLAIKILEKRIKKYKSELVKLSFLKTESLSELFFADSKRIKINLEITNLQKAIKVLTENI